MKIIRYLVAAILLSLISLGGAVQAQSSSIVDLEYVKAAQQRGVIIWDVRASNQYLEGHIPGAINVSDIGTVLRDPNREDFIDLAEINSIFNKAGLDINKEIICMAQEATPTHTLGCLPSITLAANKPRFFMMVSMAGLMPVY
jgi:thiosulfate/3-mercaptopyruvate sulfurtransferase